jgi:two-component system, OmpR family, phosphate regulon sensor histidine kinase PhoR
VLIIVKQLYNSTFCNYLRIVKKSNFLLLVIATSAVLFGILLIQLYWIENAIELRREKFDQAVMESLDRAIFKLEKKEAITQVSKKFNQANSSDLNVFLQEGIDDGVESAGLSSPIVSLDSSGRNPNKEQFKIEFPGPAFKDSNTFIIRKTQKRVLRSENMSSSFNKGLTPDQIKNKSVLINDIVNELAFISINKITAERIDINTLDTLVRQELKIHGIRAEAIIDVYSANNKELLANQESEWAEELINSTYRIELFPNDYLMESDLLLILFPNRAKYLLKKVWQILVASFILISILIGIFYFTLSTIFKQKRISIIKNDFINNMTHELKTPISTISLACEALSDQDMTIDEKRRSNYVRMINQENSRLGLLVENVLKSALWDSGNFDLKRKKISLNSIVHDVVNSIEIQVKNRGGIITTSFTKETDTIEGDKVHITNLVFNLLDNAIKYSKDQPEIYVSTEIKGTNIVLIVEDKGIGISKIDQKKIFEKFYRVPTGNIHDVKGFGLGLNYVKEIVQKHGGKLFFTSKLGLGSKFSIYLPLNKKK